MSQEIIIFSLLGILVVILSALNVVLVVRSSKINRKFEELLQKGKVKDFKEILLSHKEKSNELEEKIKKAFLKIKELEEISKISLQKVGVVRYNPFNEMGGNQSFVIALLDNENNGLVITSLFVNDGNRVYAKEVKLGKSEHTLSKEEQEAIKRATN